MASCRLIILVSVIYFSQAFLVSGEQIIDIEALTVEDAINVAIENSTEIKSANVEIRSEKEKLDEETLWQWLKPSISLRGGYDFDEGEPRTSMSFSIDLKDLMGRGKKRIKGLKYSINERQKKLTMIESLLRIRVIGAYKGYWNAKEKLRLTEEMLKNDEDVLVQIEAGGSRTDMLLIRSMINQERLAVMSSRQEFDRAEKEFREILGIGWIEANSEQTAIEK